MFCVVALRLGWDVAESIIPGRPFDFLVNDTGEWVGEWAEVQVKRVYPKSGDGSRTVNMVRSGSGENYGKWDSDWLAAVEVETSTIWMIPWHHRFEGHQKALWEKGRVTITEAYDEYKLGVG